jgi:hypothetical protein
MPSLAARWEARLEREGLAAEPKTLSLCWSGRGGSLASLDKRTGRCGRGGGMVGAGMRKTMHDYLATDHSRVVYSIPHGKLAAAVWRFPFKARRRAYRDRLLAIGVGCTCSVEYVEAVAYLRERAERKIVRLLAKGATSRQAAKRARVSLTVVVALRRAVMQWEDPDDEH